MVGESVNIGPDITIHLTKMASKHIANLVWWTCVGQEAPLNSMGLQENLHELSSRTSPLVGFFFFFWSFEVPLSGMEKYLEMSC